MKTLVWNGTFEIVPDLNTGGLRKVRLTVEAPYYNTVESHPFGSTTADEIISEPADLPMRYMIDGYEVSRETAVDTAGLSEVEKLEGGV